MQDGVGLEDRARGKAARLQAGIGGLHHQWREPDQRYASELHFDPMYAERVGLEGLGPETLAADLQPFREARP
jgi:hypothetical protein